jgi:orotate phosphoribosyltransferase
MSLFNLGDFILHSGVGSSFKIDCDALTDNDLESLASAVSEHFIFSSVEGVPDGGLRFAEALRKYSETSEEIAPLLIVDDVLTTGTSMEEQRRGREAIGIVIFSRAPIQRELELDWIQPIFSAMLPL